MIAVVVALAVSAGVLLLLAFVDRMLFPVWAKRTVQRLSQNNSPRNSRTLESPKNGTVIASRDFLTIINNEGESAELRWIEVEEIHAYKRDLLTTDLICLAFKKLGEDRYYEIHEEMAGYQHLLDDLPSCLPEFSMQWIWSVAFPAFETNHQIIWKRSSAEAA